MPVAFLILGLLTILVTVLACCGLATEYGMPSLVYFLLIILLIGLEIGLGAYWVHIQPDYPPAFSNMPVENSTIHPNYTTRATAISPYNSSEMTDLPDISFSPDFSVSGDTATPPIITTTTKIPPKPIDSDDIDPHKIEASEIAVEDEKVVEDGKVVNETTNVVIVKSVVVDFEAFERSEDWRSFQLTFKCCGINGAKDFIDRGEGVPPECCNEKTINGSAIVVCELKKSAQKGCLEVLLVRLYVDRLILGILSIVAGSLTLIMLVTSFFIRYDDDLNVTDDDDDFFEGHEFCPPSGCR